MKVRILAFVALLVLLGATGCDLFAPSHTADLQPKAQTVDVEEEFGGAVATFSFTVEGDVVIEYGDGAANAMIGGITTRTVVQHTYTKIGTYQVVLRKGVVKYGEATVTVTADLPDVHVPFWWQGIYVSGGDILDFQVVYRTPGCDAGTGRPLYEYGVRAGDGWTEVRLMAWDSSNRPIGVFDSRTPYGSQAAWGKWVRLPDSERDPYTLTVFAMNYDCQTPPFPLVPRSVEEDLVAKGCGGNDPWPDPDTPPTPDTPNYEDHMRFRLEARNPYTVEGQEPYIEWKVWLVDDGGCS